MVNYRLLLWTECNFVIHKAVCFSAIEGTGNIIELPGIDLGTCRFNIIYVFLVFTGPYRIGSLGAERIAYLILGVFRIKRRAAIKTITAGIPATAAWVSQRADTA
jgi:hypothetical protein